MFALEGFAAYSIFKFMFMPYFFFDAHPKKWQAHSMSLDLQYRMDIKFLVPIYFISDRFIKIKDK